MRVLAVLLLGCVLTSGVWAQTYAGGTTSSGGGTTTSSGGGGTTSSGGGGTTSSGGGDGEGTCATDPCDEKDAGPEEPETAGPETPSDDFYMGGGRRPEGGGEGEDGEDGHSTDPDGCSTTNIPASPPEDTGQSGTALCYTGGLVVPLEPSGEVGCVLPLPQGIFEHPDEVQPRPGNLPGCILYRDDLLNIYLHFGSPNSASGGNAAQFTKIPGSGGGGGGSGGDPIAKYESDTSGAQLWTFNGYVEIKHTDGTIARFESFINGPNGTTLWRVVSVKDPYDNTATYHYDAGNRLEKISYPSGIDQNWNWFPVQGWTGWDTGTYSLLEITYTDRFAAGGPTLLPEYTWGMAFKNGPNGETHFAGRIFRIYSPERRTLADTTPGVLYDVGSLATTRHVREFNYDVANEVTELEFHYAGGGFPFSVSATNPAMDVFRTIFDTAGRPTFQSFLLTGVSTTYLYDQAPTRTADLLPGATLSATVVTDAVGNKRTMEYDVNTGRLYREIRTPAAGYVGRPRENDPGNAGLGANATVEPDRIIVDYLFDGSCTCHKPIEVRLISESGAASATRVFKYQYDSESKLVTKVTIPNPSTAPGAPAEVSYDFTYVRSVDPTDPEQVWGPWLPATEVTPDGTWEYAYSDWQTRGTQLDPTPYYGAIPGKIVRRMAGVRLQQDLSGDAVQSPAYVQTEILLNLWSAPGNFSQSGPIQGQPRVITDGDGVATLFEYDQYGHLDQTVEGTGGVVTQYDFDPWGTPAQVRENVGATGLEATIDIDASVVGAPYSVTVASGAQVLETRFHYDRWGNLAVVQRKNQDSSGNPPSRHGATSNARAWVTDQYHYQHMILMESYRDRRPLDEADPGGGPSASVMLKTAYDYHANGRLRSIVNPNGSETFVDYDGYGTFYKSYTHRFAGDLESPVVRGPKVFINDFLEPSAAYQSTGSDDLWTVLERNAAGAVTAVTEPSTQCATAPRRPLGPHRGPGLNDLLGQDLPGRRLSRVLAILARNLGSQWSAACGSSRHRRVR